MGASTWNYFVPYDTEPAHALQRLREDVFRNKQYGNGIPSADEMRAQLEQFIAISPDPTAARANLEAGIKKIEELRSQIPKLPEPRSIEELLAQRAESGTHSILDIQSIAPEPTFGAVCPMPIDELVRIFGTSRPTHDIVQEMLSDEQLAEHPLICERWQGVYFTIYGDDRPTELCFIGTSGD